MVWLYLQDCTYFTRKEILRWANSIWVILRHGWIFVLFSTIPYRNSKRQYQEACPTVGLPGIEITWYLKSCFQGFNCSETQAEVFSLLTLTDKIRFQLNRGSLLLLNYKLHSRVTQWRNTEHILWLKQGIFFILTLPRLFYRYRDLAPQLVPLDYTNHPDVKLPYELIGSMPELKVGSTGPCRPAPSLWSQSIINSQLIDRILWKLTRYPTPLNLKNAGESLMAHLLEMNQLYIRLFARWQVCLNTLTCPMKGRVRLWRLYFPSLII